MNDVINSIEEGMKRPEIGVTKIEFFNNKLFEGVEVSWSGNIGFGSMVLAIDRKNKKLFLSTEQMGGKNFAKKVFDKIIDACEVED